MGSPRLAWPCAQYIWLTVAKPTICSANYTLFGQKLNCAGGVKMVFLGVNLGR